MQNKKLTIKQSILWNTCGSMMYLVVQWLETILVTRLLGYEDAGVFSLAMSVTNIFYALSIYGMVNFQVSDITGKYSAGTYVISRAATGVGAFLLCFLFVAINSYDSRQTTCIVAYMFFKLSETFFDVFLGFYQRNWRMDLAGKSLVTRAVLIIIVFPTVILTTKDLLIAILTMAAVVFCVIFVYDMRNVYRLEDIQCIRNIKQVKCLLIECFPLAIYLILSTSIASIPRFFLEMFHGSEKLGIYASVAAPTLIVQTAATYIFNPMITVFSESLNKKDKPRFLKTLQNCIKAIVIISIVAVTGGKLLGRLGLSILYGESILEYEYLLIPLIVCTITTAFTWLFCAILTVLRNFRALLIGSGCSVVFSIIISMVFIPVFEMQGTTYALMLGNFAGMLVLICFILRDIKKKFAAEE